MVEERESPTRMLTVRFFPFYRFFPSVDLRKTALTIVLLSA